MKLRELIEKATPGPWPITKSHGHPCYGSEAIEFHLHAGSDDPAIGHGNTFAIVSLGGVGATSARPDAVSANAHLMSRCNPATMLAVLEIVERASLDARSMVDMMRVLGNSNELREAEDKLENIQRVLCLLNAQP